MSFKWVLAGLFAVGVVGPGLAGADVGSFVPVKAEGKPVTVEAKVGDLVKVAVRFPVVPGKMVSELKVELSGQGLSKVGVFTVPVTNEDGKVLFGAGEVAAFLKVEKAGQVTVRVTPNNGDSATTVTVKVAAK